MNRSLARLILSFAVMAAIVAAIPGGWTPRAQAGSLSTDIIGMFPKDVGEFAYADMRAARSRPWFPQLRDQLLPGNFRQFEQFLTSAGIDPNTQVDEMAWATLQRLERRRRETDSRRRARRIFAELHRRETESAKSSLGRGSRLPPLRVRLRRRLERHSLFLSRFQYRRFRQSLRARKTNRRPFRRLRKPAAQRSDVSAHQRSQWPRHSLGRARRALHASRHAATSAASQPISASLGDHRAAESHGDLRHGG